MKLIGITGGVGMGKSAAQALLVERGISVVDTDQIARELVEPGQFALAEIESQFGRDILDPQGALRRDALAEIVFADPEARHRLESILHPRIRSCWMDVVKGWRRSRKLLGAVVIPLLFETDAASDFDVTVCVACSEGTQIARLEARGWSQEDIRRRLAAQWPVARKMETADRVIWTEGPMEAHKAQWDMILESL